MTFITIQDLQWPAGRAPVVPGGTELTSPPDPFVDEPDGRQGWVLLRGHSGAFWVRWEHVKPFDEEAKAWWVERGLAV